MGVQSGQAAPVADDDSVAWAGIAGGVSADAFLGGEIIAYQPRRGYRAGIDAVLLAASVPSPPGRVRDVLDLGAGVGVVGLCVARRLVHTNVTLLEREPELADLARRNALANRLDDRVRICEADLTAPADQSGLQPERFDHILANPPFFDPDTCRPPRDRLRAASHVMPADGLDTWLRTMARLTRPGGTATMIHRADSLGDLLAAFSRRFGGVEVRSIHPREATPASRVLVTGRKGSRARVRILPPIVLHDESNAFRPEIARVLREPVGLTDITIPTTVD
jgi:tRNA1(Val) A37 N6-methylase TrmN6